MANVPLSWKLSISGAEEVKTKLRDVNQQFERGEITTSDYAKELRALGRDARSFNSIQNLQKNIFLASHPGVLRLSKAMSTFGSVARTALTITNALNLATIANNGINSQLTEAQTEVARAQRRVNELIAAGKTGTEEYQKAVEDLAIAQDKLKEIELGIKEQEFQDFITKINAAILTISTVFNTILNNETIRNAVFSGASRLGTLFGSVFTGFATLIMSAVKWLNIALFGGGLADGSTKAGMANGRLFGTAFGIAAGLAAAAGAVIMLDIVNEILTGKSTLEDIQKRLGVPEDQRKSGTDLVKDVSGVDLKPKRNPAVTEKAGVNPIVGGIAGIGGPVLNIIPRLIEQVDKAFREQDNIFQPLIDIFQKGIPEAYAETENTLSKPLDVQAPIDQTGAFQPLIDLFTITIPDAYTAAKDAFSMTWLTDIPALLTEASAFISQGFVALWNGVIGTVNFAGATITEGINTVFAALIAQMNQLIAAYNRAAKKLGKPTIAPIVFTQSVFNPLESIPAVAAARGFSGVVSSPTLFLAGEAGAETVNITPNGRGNGNSGGSQTVVINVQGSVISEKQLMKIFDNHQKNNLKRRGFTGI